MTGALVDRQSVAAWLRVHDDYLIGSHMDPDGDSLGSSLALAMGLDRLGKRATVAIGQPMPRAYTWLPAAERVITLEAATPDIRASILVECSDFARGGIAGLDSVPSLNIDHHTKNRRFADLNWIDPGVAATGMMVRDLLVDLGVAIDASIATLLYVTVLTDTGSFHHSNTDAAALAFAADMVAAGADASAIAERVYGNVPLARLRLTIDALTSLEVTDGGKVATLRIPAEVFARHGTADTEGLINEAQNVEGVAVTILVKEVEAGRCRVSLRSDGSIDVAELAAAHGGGGHPRAAGFQRIGPPDEVAASVRAEVVALLGGPAEDR